jgi:uncharacterized protein YcaQ
VLKRLPAELTISQAQARQFLLAHLDLAPPRSLAGKQGAVDFVRKVNCIQYDPINIVGQNPHLVLQARVKGYKPAMLNEVLYTDRTLIDGFDKVMSIYPVEDWSQFSYYRQLMVEEYIQDTHAAPAAKRSDWVLNEIKTRGPLSSLELEDSQRMDWWTVNTVKTVRITMEILFYSGNTVVHHRVGTRRYFDLATRVLPTKFLKGKKSADEETYKDWHVYRRSGSVGLVHMKTDNKWIGIIAGQGGNIRESVRRLANQGELVPIAIESIPREEFYVRRVDLPALKPAEVAGKFEHRAAFIAPLDNLMWQRTLLNLLFGFDYVWEVYTAKEKRKWGYYVLPVLSGDRFVARIDPGYDRANKTFVIHNWWWEAGVDKKDEAMLLALQECVRSFSKYLGAKSVKLGDSVKQDRTLKKIIEKVV